jgi:rod shape determining protein RodA
MTPLFRKLLGINWLLFVVVAGLLTFGVYSIYSATSGLSDPVLANMWSNQVIYIGLGVIGFFVASLIDYRWIRWGALPFYVLCIVFLLMTNEKNGTEAESWLKLPAIRAFQPSQPAIMSGIMLMAVIFGELPKMHKIFESSLLRLVLAGPVTAVPCLLILQEPDFGSSVVWIAVFMVMLVVGRILFRYIIVIVLLGVTVLPVLYFFGLKNYQKERIETWLSMLNEQPYDEVGAGWVPKHNMIAIGSAGLIGKGHAGEKTDGKLVTRTFTPPRVAVSDYIFVTIAEQHGFRGGLALVGGFTAFVLLLLFMGYHARDQMGRLIIGGFVALIFFHVYMNIGMCILLMPITGVPLPFISNGGTFVMMLLVMLGMCQSVWIHRHHELPEPSREDNQPGDSIQPGRGRLAKA